MLSFLFLSSVEMINNGISTFDVKRVTNFYQLINYIVYIFNIFINAKIINEREFSMLFKIFKLGVEKILRE